MSTAGNEIDFIVPKEGCDSPMIETATFPGGGIFTLNVPKKLSPLVNAGKQDVPLISASEKGVWYRHVSPGINLFIR